MNKLALVVLLVATLAACGGHKKATPAPAKDAAAAAAPAKDGGVAPAKDAAPPAAPAPSDAAAH